MIEHEEGEKLTEGRAANVICGPGGPFNHIKHIAMANSHLPGWEADLLVVSRERYAREIEIKLTRADFLSEFKPENKDTRSYSKQAKHLRFEEGHPKNIIKFYAIAVPTELLPLAQELAPKYAGLISISDYYWEKKGKWFWSAKFVRKSTAIKARKLTDNELLAVARNACQRVWSLRLTGKSGRG